MSSFDEYVNHVERNADPDQAALLDAFEAHFTSLMRGLRQAAGGETRRRDDLLWETEGMCPNCVKPWKYNGPHIPPDGA